MSPLHALPVLSHSHCPCHIFFNQFLFVCVLLTKASDVSPAVSSVESGCELGQGTRAERITVQRHRN